MLYWSLENVLLKTKVEEKKQTSITDFFKKWYYILEYTPIAIILILVLFLISIIWYNKQNWPDGQACYNESWVYLYFSAIASIQLGSHYLYDLLYLNK